MAIFRIERRKNNPGLWSPYLTWHNDDIFGIPGWGRGLFRLLFKSWQFPVRSVLATLCRVIGVRRPELEQRRRRSHVIEIQACGSSNRLYNRRIR
jgi:hypothetical protein